MCSDLWGKEARNNSAILRAWDGLSQFRTMIVKTLEVVEFTEALESSMECARRVSHPSIKNDSSAVCEAGRAAAESSNGSGNGETHTREDTSSLKAH